MQVCLSILLPVLKAGRSSIIRLVRKPAEPLGWERMILRRTEQARLHFRSEATPR